MSAGRLEASWLNDAGLQRLLALLGADGEEARIVGGAIRNTLLGQPVTDIDIATTSEPGETMRRLQAAGVKAVDTGMEHGTVTAVIDGHGYEITTLREDTETDGRRAVVAFTDDWAEDAARLGLSGEVLARLALESPNDIAFVARAEPLLPPLPAEEAEIQAATGALEAMSRALSGTAEAV